MRLNRILAAVAILATIIFYVGCHKNDSAAPQISSTKSNGPLTSMEYFSPENVPVKGITVDGHISITQAAILLQNQSNHITDLADSGSTYGSLYASYLGYSRTYNCLTNSWSYTFNWLIVQGPGFYDFQITADSGLLNIGTFSQTAALVVDSTAAINVGSTLPPGKYYYTSYTISGIPSNSNYCGDSTMTNTVSVNYKYYYEDSTYSKTWAGNHTDSLTASSYVIKPFIVDSAHEVNDTAYNIYVNLDSLACKPCHQTSLGVSPTENFYYHLVGSSSAWSYTTVSGSADSTFSVRVKQSGTYEYYTQGYITSGVLSGELYYGTIAVP